MNKHDLHSMLNQALESKVGIRIAVSDASQFKSKFYSLRADLIKDTAFEKYKDLKLLTSNTPDELWLIKKSILDGGPNE